MIAHCIFCHHKFPANRELEHFPVARRIAFDPARGRLWAVCDQCQRWTLAPFEARWEALEQLEKTTRDRATLLLQGENVALLRAGEVELVRIGKADLREEAWWRYGREMLKRQKDALSVIRRGKIFDAAIWMLIIGIPIWAGSDAQGWIDNARRKRMGKIAWAGSLRCDACGAPVDALAFKEQSFVRLTLQNERTALRVPCAKCERGFALLGGADSEQTLRRLLAYRNFAGASRVQIEHATREIGQAGSATRLVVETAREQPLLVNLSEVASLSLEIALSDQTERRQLAGEVKELEAEWRISEEIANIVDRELT